MLSGAIGYGAMQLTGRSAWNSPDDWSAAVGLLREAHDCGVGLIDTAWYYGPYVAQQLIADALYPYPNDLVLVTKAGNSRGLGGSWAPALSPQDIRKACQIDQKLLRVETLPLVLLRWSPLAGDEAFGEAVGTLIDLQQAGGVANIGLSNVSMHHLRLALTMTPVAAVSNAYSLDQRRGADVLEACAAAHIPFLPYYPLHGGRTLRHPLVKQVAQDLGATPAQIAIAWLCAQSDYVVPIPGSRSRRHLRENVEAQRMVLPSPAREVLDQGGGGIAYAD